MFSLLSALLNLKVPIEILDRLHLLVIFLEFPYAFFYFLKFSYRPFLYILKEKKSNNHRTSAWTNYLKVFPDEDKDTNIQVPLFYLSHYKLVSYVES